MLNKILKIAEANAKISDLKSIVKAEKEERLRVEAELSDSQDFSSSLKGELAERDIEIKALEDELLKAKKANQVIINKSLDATQQAAEIVAGIGISEPIQEEDKKSKSNDEVQEEFNALSDPAEQMNFYKMHRQQLLNLTKENISHGQ